MKSYHIIFAPESRTDLIASLNNFPHKHPIHNKNIRKFVFPKFTNYSAYFEIDDENERLVVLAITASKQFSRYMKF